MTGSTAAAAAAGTVFHQPGPCSENSHTLVVKNSFKGPIVCNISVF